jgi:hypothetical protein
MQDQTTAEEISMSNPEPFDFEDIATFEQADTWLEAAGSKGDDDSGPLDQADAIARILADALRQRGAIDPQTYAAVYDNPDYATDEALLGDVLLTDLERRAIMAAAGSSY